MDSELKLVIDILQTDLKQIYGMRVEDIAYVLGINRRTYITGAMVIKIIKHD